VEADTDGRTSLPGLYAAGECASTGVHGANRLASNSLSECFVFGARAAEAALAEPAGAGPIEPERTAVSATAPLTRASREALWRYAGIERSGEGLRTLAADRHPLVRLIARSALTREESRGAHQRTDFPSTRPSWGHAHVTLGAGREPAVDRWR
jgi:L-aspartate oxidase